LTSYKNTSIFSLEYNFLTPNLTLTIRDKKMDAKTNQPAPPQRRAERTQIMTPKEAAKYLGFHLVTIYRLLKKQEIPATKIGGQWRFKKDILDAWLLNRMKQG
jgi:excisionase family DNA binding protein